MAKSSFNGKINEFPFIRVDNFESPAKVSAKAYFLSHTHTDHTKGLFDERFIDILNETKAYIYMTEFSAVIVEEELKSKGAHLVTIMKYIKPLEHGRHLITIPGDCEDDETVLNVTVIPAGHSIGSVMFLFHSESTNQTVLFTGDFRINENDLPKYAQLHNKDGDPIKIDAMYVDTTFLHPMYEYFPKRSISVEAALEKIKKWLSQNEENRVALYFSAKYGYEYFINEIYDKLNVKVYVDESKWNVYSKVNVVHGATNDGKELRIHACRTRYESNHLKCFPQDTIFKQHKYLYVYCSAMKWANFTHDDVSYNDVSDTRIDICFATHCSSRELNYFIRFFSTKKIVGFPDDYREYKNKNNITPNKFTVTPKKRSFSPNNLKTKREDKKVDRTVLRDIFGLKKNKLCS